MDKIIWTENKNNSYSIGHYKYNEIGSNESIASFDLDHTIIKPKNNKTFSKKNVSDDWIFITDEIINKLQELADNKYRLVIVTNQKKLNKNKIQYDAWKQKIEIIANAIDRSLIILTSFANDIYRKPLPFILTNNIKFNINGSFYCGDAGGINKSREMQYNNETIILKSDFSDTDYKFALNLKIKFIHRDEFVYNFKTDITKIKLNYPNFTTKVNNAVIKKKFQKEIIIMVGMPASGKSTLTKFLVTNENYKIINQDTMKTASKCIKELIKLVQLGENIIIDNTNPTVEIRKKYISVVQNIDTNYKIRCICFRVEKDICIHNNYMRHITNNSIPLIPTIAYNVFKSKYQEPTISEGFSEIIDYYYDPNVASKYYVNNSNRLKNDNAIIYCF